MKAGPLLALFLALLGGFGALATRDTGASVREFAEFLSYVSARFEQALEELVEPLMGGDSPPPLTIGIVTSPAISTYADASTKNWEQYAKLHKYQIKVVREGVDEACGPDLAEAVRQKTGQFAGIWAKVCLLRDLLHQHNNSASVEHYVMVVDADTFVQRPEFDVVDELVRHLLLNDQRAAGLMFDDRQNASDYPGCWNGGPPAGGGEDTCRPNTFLMLFKSGSDSLQFVDSWLQHALGDCAGEASSFPPTQRVLWNCLLPESDKKHPGLLQVVNGMTRYYTMSLRDPELPLVHFQPQKGKHLRSVTKAIARVQPLLDKSDETK